MGRPVRQVVGHVGTPVAVPRLTPVEAPRHRVVRGVGTGLLRPRDVAVPAVVGREVDLEGLQAGPEPRHGPTHLGDVTQCDTRVGVPGPLPSVTPHTVALRVRPGPGVVVTCRRRPVGRAPVEPGQTHSLPGPTTRPPDTVQPTRSGLDGRGGTSQ